MAQIGPLYVWGGDGPTNGDAGLDYSGLTAFSFATAGVSLPRMAQTQLYGPYVPQGAALQPGNGPCQESRARHRTKQAQATGRSLPPRTPGTMTRAGASSSASVTHRRCRYS